MNHYSWVNEYALIVKTLLKMNFMFSLTVRFMKVYEVTSM